MSTTKLIVAAELMAGDVMSDPNGPLLVEHVGTIGTGAVRVLVSAVDDEFCQTWTFAASDLCTVTRSN